MGNTMAVSVLQNIAAVLLEHDEMAMSDVKDPAAKRSAISAPVYAHRSSHSSRSEALKRQLSTRGIPVCTHPLVPPPFKYKVKGGLIVFQISQERPSGS